MASDSLRGSHDCHSHLKDEQTYFGAGRVLREIASNVWAADRPFLWNGIDVGVFTSAKAVSPSVPALNILVVPFARHSLRSVYGAWKVW